MVVLIKRTLSAALFLALYFCAPTAHAAVFYPEHYTLANGVQVVIVKNRLSTAVGHMVWYKVGAADEVKGKTGLAHYLEHMMFKGTDKVPTGAFHDFIASKGGEENAFTSYDFTAYYEIVAGEHLGAVMHMEADRMRNLRFSKDQATQEKSVVLSERQQRTENTPNGLFLEKLRSSLFPEHPYGRPVIGWRADIEGLSSQDVKDFCMAYYAPQSTIVVVSGNVESHEVLRLASATYGALPQQKIKKSHPFPRPKVPSQTKVVHADKRVTQPYATRQIIAPSLGNNKKAAHALEVLSEVLDAEVGLLHRKFVVEKKMASGVAVAYQSIKRGPSLFTVASSPAPGQDVEVLEKAITAYLKEVAKNGVPEKQVRGAKQRLLDSAIFARDKLMAPAQIIGKALAAGYSLDAVEMWPDRIGAVKTVEVNAALRELMTTPYQIVGFLKPAEAGDK